MKVEVPVHYKEPPSGLGFQEAPTRKGEAFSELKERVDPDLPSCGVQGQYRAGKGQWSKGSGRTVLWPWYATMIRG